MKCRFKQVKEMQKHLHSFLKMSPFKDLMTDRRCILHTDIDNTFTHVTKKNK